MERGQVADAIASFYDAVSSAMIAAFIEVAGSKSAEKLRSYDDHDIFLELKRANRIDGTFSMGEFDYISDTAEQALEFILDGFDAGRFVSAVESMLTQLGVLPIVGGELPEEQSETL